MNKAGKILSLNPPNAIPGGEVLIECEGLKLEDFSSFGCYFDGHRAQTVGASSERIIAIVPETVDNSVSSVYIENEGYKSEAVEILIGKKLAEGLHLVANPAVDPKDNSIVVTRSGSRGHQLPVTLFRIQPDGFLEEMPATIMNPTGVAFDQHGKLLVTSRADGEVCQINHDKEIVPIASDLGVATGIAFDKDGVMYVGDRGGMIFRIPEPNKVETWSILDPSVSAYHLAFGNDENLYISAPGLCSFDSIYRINKDGLDEVFFKGLGRPQGLAFDRNGNLYIAACLRGRNGIVRISPSSKNADLIVAGMLIVGLCFSRDREMIVATNDKIYSLPLNIHGILLD